jgi:hypothetical protein
MTIEIVRISPEPGPAFRPLASLVLGAGDWEVRPAASEHPGTDSPAWNAWSGQVVAGERPNTYAKGWLNTFTIWSPGLVGGQTVLAGGDSVRYGTPEAALAAALETRFRLAREAIVTFYIDDSYVDDRGGLTLEIKLISRTGVRPTV